MTSIPGNAVETLRQTLGQFQAALSVVDDAIAIFSHSNNFLWCNKSFEDFTGTSRMMLLGKNLEEWMQQIGLEEDVRCKLETFLNEEAERQSNDNSFIFSRDHRGIRCTYMVESHYVAYKDDSKSLVFILKNITDKYKALDLQKRADLLEKLSERCPLTALLNRRGLEKRLNYILSEGMKDGLALMFCDVDKFKSINDTYGHDVGDQVLRRISSLLRQSIRGEDFVGRLAGDEFLVCIVNEPRQIESVARSVSSRILNSLAKKYTFNRRNEDFEFEIRMSLGIAFGRDASSVDQLMRNADLAMYQAKSTKSMSYFYDSKLMAKNDVDDFIRQVSDAHFSSGLIPFHLQPIVSVESSEVVGYEVLVRPISSDGVLIPAGEFIGFHEEKGVIESVDRLLVESLFNQLNLEIISGDRFISINLSAITLCSQRFSSFLIDSIRSSQVSFEHVVIEITETAFVRNQSSLRAVVEYLASYGIRIYLDDFGVGQAGLAYLIDLPIHGLKIDSSLFNRSKENDKARSLLSSFVLFSDQLNLDLIVEGVEQESDLIHLHDLHIDWAQGYKLSPPMPQEAFCGSSDFFDRTLCCPLSETLRNPFRLS